MTPTPDDAPVTVQPCSASIERAIERGEFRAVYQPIIRLSSAECVGFESLIRWDHPEYGLLTPDQFIVGAERDHAINAIDTWMLGQACREFATWDRGASLSKQRVSVNVSRRLLDDDCFPARLRALLDSVGLDPMRLRLEVTERVIVYQAARVARVCAAIRKMGVALDLDDFGTGYSSLHALQGIAVDALKIDGSFVESMMTVVGAGLIETIVFLARRLGVATVAEGIETREQALWLTEIGCDYGQGYLYAEPLDPQAARQFALNQSRRQSSVNKLRSSA